MPNDSYGLPVSAIELNLNGSDLEEIINSIKIMKNTPTWKKIDIWSRAEEVISCDKMGSIIELRDIFAGDEEVYKRIGIPYKDGPPQEQEIFICGILNYLLDHPDKLCERLLS